MFNAKSVLWSFSAVLILSACEMKSNLDEMHTSTVQMEKTTGDLNTLTGELYDALRQGDALQSRRTALNIVRTSTEPLRKLSESAKYYMAFEFNLWTGMGKDDSLKKREVLATLAAQEFFKDVEEFIPNGDMVAQPFAGQIFASDKSNLVNSFNALAATLHYMNPKQTARLAEMPDLKPITMLSLIEESLLAKVEIESGRKKLSDYPGYVKEILFSEQEAIYLLQARYNYLPTLVIGKTTNAEYSKITGTRIYLAPWTLDLSALNTAQLTELDLFMKESQRAKALLLAIGVQPYTDGMLERVMGNMRIKKSLKAASETRSSLENSFSTGVETFLKP